MNSCKYCGKSLSDARFLLFKNKIYKSCPNCSTETSQHAFYSCPESFGTTTKRITEGNPMGLQSYCSKCRSGHNGPHDNILSCSSVDKGYIIEDVRLLPMSNKIFTSLEKAKDFIINTMPNRGGTFYYINAKMTCSPNTLVLFQFGGKLIGYAVHNQTIRLSEPKITDGEPPYNGYYQFYPESINLFTQPITNNDLKRIDPYFRTFNQSFQRIQVGLLPAIFELINNTCGYNKPLDFDASLPEEIDENMQSSLYEGAKKQVTVNAYERNTAARVACINYYRKKNNGRLKCEICGFDFGQVYGRDFEDKIHIHHLVEISSIGKEYKINATTDLIPICPNCHMIAHSKKPAYTPDEIKVMISKNKRYLD